MQYCNNHTAIAFVEVSLPIYLVHPKPYKHLIRTTALWLHLLHFQHHPASCKNFPPKNAVTQEFLIILACPITTLLQTYYNNQITKLCSLQISTADLHTHSNIINSTNFPTDALYLISIGYRRRSSAVFYLPIRTLILWIGWLLR